MLLEYKEEAWQRRIEVATILHVSPPLFCLICLHVHIVIFIIFRFYLKNLLLCVFVERLFMAFNALWCLVTACLVLLVDVTRAQIVLAILLQRMCTRSHYENHWA